MKILVIYDGHRYETTQTKEDVEKAAEAIFDSLENLDKLRLEIDRIDDKHTPSILLLGKDAVGRAAIIFKKD